MYERIGKAQARERQRDKINIVIGKGLGKMRIGRDCTTWPAIWKRKPQIE